MLNSTFVIHHLMSGEVAIVTGRSSGSGKTTAIAFAREAAKVAIAPKAEY